MRTINTLAFLAVLLWVAGWTIAALRAGFGHTPCPVRDEADGDTEQTFASL